MSSKGRFVWWIIERFCPFEEKCGRNPIIQSTHVCCCTHLDVSHLTGQTETQLHHLSRKGRAADRCSFKRVVGWGSRMLSCCCCCCGCCCCCCSYSCSCFFLEDGIEKSSGWDGIKGSGSANKIPTPLQLKHSQLKPKPITSINLH